MTLSNEEPFTSCINSRHGQHVMKMIFEYKLEENKHILSHKGSTCIKCLELILAWIYGSQYFIIL